MLFIYSGILALAQSISALKLGQTIELNVSLITKALQDYE
jgi:hypothetical protein